MSVMRVSGFGAALEEGKALGPMSTWATRPGDPPAGPASAGTEVMATRRDALVSSAAIFFMLEG